MSFVPTSWNQPVLTGEFTGLGVTRMLEAIRQVDPSIRFYQASSSEMFGKVREIPQTELTPFHPAQPVRRGEGIRPLPDGQLPRELRHVRGLGDPLQPRVAAPRPRVRDPQGHRRRRPHHARHWRTSSGWATSTRSATGVSPATTSGRCGRCCSSPSRPTTSSPPASPTPSATCAAIAFEHVGLDYEKYVVIDERLYRPAEVDHLLGDSAKARAELGWEPHRRGSRSWCG